MANESFTKLLTSLSSAVGSRASTVSCAGDKFSSWKELLDLCDRASMIDDLKRKLKDGCKAKDFVPLASRIDFASAVERDLRLRARPRVAAMILDRSPGFAQESLTQLDKELKKIET